MKWHHETKSIDSLLPNPNNPRRITKAQVDELKKSIEKFGFCEPVVVNYDYSVIGGHQRLEVLKKLGYETVNVSVPETPLSKSYEEELTLRLNKNGGEWDYDALANFCDLDIVMEAGFSMEELHLESLPGTEEPEEEPKKQSCTMTIKFLDVDHLQEAENQIATIVDAYQGATYKVKVK